MNTPTQPPALPDPVDELAMEDGFNVIGVQPVYTADQMRAYAKTAIAQHCADMTLLAPSTHESLRTFLDAAAGEGYVLSGVDAGDLYMELFPEPGAALATAPASDKGDAELSQAARDVLAERKRQIERKGYEPEADDEYEGAELSSAAATYALLATGEDGWRVEDHWPWALQSLKKSDPRRMLEKAGALILAEMERLDRAAIDKARQSQGADHHE